MTKEEKLLIKSGIDSGKSVLFISKEEALSNLLETVEEYCPDLKVDKMSKEDIEILLESYGNCVIDYHPENSHQERGALLRNFDMLKKHGLSDEDYSVLDFV